MILWLSDFCGDRLVVSIEKVIYISHILNISDYDYHKNPIFLIIIFLKIARGNEKDSEYLQIAFLKLVVDSFIFRDVGPELKRRY